MTRTVLQARAGAATVAAVVLGVAGLTACSSPGPSQGYEQLEGDRVTVEYPEGWTEGKGSGEIWTLAARGEGGSVQVADPFDNSRVVSAALGRLRLPAQLELEGYEPGDTRDITVDGADSAIVQTFTYVDGDEPARGAWIIAGQRDPAATVVVSIGGHDVDDALISHVIDSLHFEPSTEPVPQETS